MLISSHIVSDLEKVCDYIAFLHKGKLMLLEEKDVLLSEYGLLQCSKEEAETIEPSGNNRPPGQPLRLPSYCPR